MELEFKLPIELFGLN